MLDLSAVADDLKTTQVAALSAQLVDAVPICGGVGESAAELGERRGLGFLERAEEHIAFAGREGEQRDAAVEPIGDPAGESPPVVAVVEERRDESPQILVADRDAEQPHGGERIGGEQP
jgi:hypothetical protein